MEFINGAIVAIYLAAMLAFGWWGKSRTKNSSDYLVAGRRLGPFLYTGTMAAVVLGGASTVGGVGLGYKWGISGMWLVVAIGAGVILLSVFFAPTLQKLKVGIPFDVTDAGGRLVSGPCTRKGAAAIHQLMNCGGSSNLETSSGSDRGARWSDRGPDPSS